MSFDRFMVANSIGTNRKLRRLPVAQRWVYVAGVLALASQSPIRGALLITDSEPATEEDVAQEATVRLAEARAAMESFRRLGMLERDADGVEWVHDWDSMNKDPKPSDSPDATRARKRAQRAKHKAQCHADVTRDNGKCHAPEVEVKERKDPPNPPTGGAETFAPPRPAGRRQRESADFDAAMTEWGDEHFPDAKAGAVAAAVSWLRSRNGSDGGVSAAGLREFATTNEMWAAELGLSTVEAAA